MNEFMRVAAIALIAAAAAMGITYSLFPPVSLGNSVIIGKDEGNATLTISRTDTDVQTVSSKVINDHQELRSAILKADLKYLESLLCAANISQTELLRCPSWEYSTEITKQSAFFIIQDGGLPFETIPGSDGLTYHSTTAIEGRGTYSISLVLQNES